MKIKKQKDAFLYNIEGVTMQQITAIYHGLHEIKFLSKLSVSEQKLYAALKKFLDKQK